MVSDENVDTPRKQLGAMVAELWEASKLTLRAASATVPDGALNVRTLRNWRDGTSAPSASLEPVFVELIKGLREAAGAHGHRCPYDDADWAKALRAAQRQGAEGRGLSAEQQHKGRRRGHGNESPAPDPKTRFVQTHLPELRVVDGLAGREHERAAMHAFIRASGPSAPSYLCWHSERPVGKTALLADYVKRPERSVNVVSFFVSEARGTNTRAVFTAVVGQQLRAFLNHQREDFQEELPHDAQGWARLLDRAAEKSATQGRKLLLIVDGLDEDAAWANCTWDEGSPASEREGTSGAVPGGSIAALLPVHPGPGLRILVSTRWSTPPSGDMPAEHPLLRRECYRTLGSSPHATAIEPASRAGADRLRAHPLGSTVMELLAVAGGGLRAVDLAELADVPVSQVERLIHGVDGRCVVLDDAVTETYALSHADILRSVRRDLGTTGVARRTARLHAWAELWRSADWPETTPPYLLQRYLHLLDDPDSRREYVLDPSRQMRLAATAGHGVALAQLDALGAEQPNADKGHVGAEHVATAVRLAASRAYLTGLAREVPLDAMLLYAELGDVNRARALARTMPGPVVEAAALARIAVVMCAKRLVEASAALAEEAVTSLSRADRTFPRPAKDTDACAEIAVAAHELHARGKTLSAFMLLRAVILSGATDIETLVAALNILPANDDQEWMAIVEAQADDLGAGDARAKAVAVDIWATLARRMPSRGKFARERIIAICDELDSSDGLAAVDVLAVAVSALKGSKAAARRFVKEAVARLSAALANPGSLSPADQAHLRREVSTTLERLSQAANDVAPFLETPAKLKDLVSTHREMLRSGLLGDDLAERGEANLAAGEDRRSTERTARRLGLLGMKPLPEKEHEGTPTDQHEHGTQPPQHIVLLRQAQRLVHDGDLLLGRERLENTLRHLPARTAPAASGSHGTYALVQGLGVVGEFTLADRLITAPPQPARKCRHLAALSIGCAQGGHEVEARHYARAAAQLAGGLHDPVLRGLTAQALAHAGEADIAEEMATRTDPEDNMPAAARHAQIRQSQTAVAAGLAQRDPETAARLIEPVIAAVELRLKNGSPFSSLPQLAGLLLAFPDIRRPGPRIRELLRPASAFAHEPQQQWHPPSVVLLALLERLHCVPDTGGVANAVHGWVSTLPPDQIPYVELAVLRAVEGDLEEAAQITEAATTSEMRSSTLAAVATHLAGTDITLATDPSSEHASLCLHLTLAHAVRDRDTYEKAAARSLVLKLLATDNWSLAIPLLPQLAPEALAPLAELALAQGSDEGDAP
ncbi:hypothetical protein AB0O64_17800 [Streptomyces sp. NPDC088341]|uniref:hypothetical protein n=1 Tax=Streptomyces sp. NPDC088341 TaxID=3154870 RepID=UPI003426128B